MSTISRNKLNELSIILSNLYNNCKNDKECFYKKNFILCI